MQDAGVEGVGVGDAEEEGVDAFKRCDVGGEDLGDAGLGVNWRVCGGR